MTWCPLLHHRRSALPSSVLSLALLLFKVTITMVHGQNIDEYDKAILDVFPPPPSTETTETQNNNNECICLPYYKCNNQSIITDGTGLIDIRINISAPCPEYIDICCYDPIAPPPPIDHRTTCGHWNLEGTGFKITGYTNEAQFGEFPWMVAILKYNEYDTTNHTYLCGGSLIHPQVVLTAIHWIYDKNPSDLVIRAGEWDTQTEKEMFPYQDRQVSKIIKHENYYGGALHNDIALIFLTSPFQMFDNVGTLCLPPQGFKFYKERCYASGWGKNVYGKEGVLQAILKKIDVPIVPREPCVDLLRQTRLGPNYNLHKSFICAGGEIGKDTCTGDGGSPLMCPIPEKPLQFHQAGIVAWGIGCGDKTPGVYVNVALFRDWIDKHILAEGLDTSYYDANYIP